MWAFDRCPQGLTSEWTGLTVISTRTRNEILESAPWLASQFRLAEATRLCAGTAGQSERYLRFDNPLLVELRRRYSNHPANDHIQWRSATVEAQPDLTSFRADNLYLFQSRRYPNWAYYATVAYAVQIDRLDLLHKLQGTTASEQRFRFSRQGRQQGPRRFDNRDQLSGSSSGLISLVCFEGIRYRSRVWKTSA